MIIIYNNLLNIIISKSIGLRCSNYQDIELKTAPEYVVGYLVEKLRNKDLLTKVKSGVKPVYQKASQREGLRLSPNKRTVKKL
jgi:hypothetical protein